MTTRDILLSFTESDIRRAVSHSVFKAGEAYQLDCMVRELDADHRARQIRSAVHGSRARPYRQAISVLPTGGSGVTIAGSCTCPVGFNCKHVVAALLEYLERGEPDEAVRVPALAVRAPAKPAAPANDLPAGVTSWLQTLQAALEHETEEYPRNVRRRLIYILRRESSSSTAGIGLTTVEVLSNGAVQPCHTQYDASRLLRSPPRFLRPSDRDILWRIVGFSDHVADAGGSLLRAIIATGRGHWAREDGPVLQLGNTIDGDIGWTMARDGSQTPAIALPAPLLPIRFKQPWYINPESGLAGPIAFDLPPGLLEALLKAPSVPAAAAAKVAAELGQRLPRHRITPPREVAPPVLVTEQLRPHLRLTKGELPADPLFVRHKIPTPHGSAAAYPIARLALRYGQVEVRNGAPNTGSIAGATNSDIIEQDGRLFRVTRNHHGESRAVEDLFRLGFDYIARAMQIPLSHPNAHDFYLNQATAAAWCDMVLLHADTLRGRGWNVEVEEDFPVKFAELDGPLDVLVQEGSGIDWFDLDIGVQVGGERINLIPALADVIANPSVGLDPAALQASAEAGRMLLVRLPDGRNLPIPFRMLAPILAPLLELFDELAPDLSGGTWRMQRQDAAALASIEAASVAAGIAWNGGEVIRSLGRQLREHGRIPDCDPPAEFGATLRPYQQRGLAWLQFLRAAGLGGVLADDMGLGKTVQTLAHLATEQSAGRLVKPALLVCPTSLIPNWRAEATRFAPTLRTVVLHGADRAERFGAIAEHDLVLTTYPLLARDHEILSAQDWHMLILDEAQVVKNPAATTSKLVRTLKASQRICLSGTPLENHLGELWSLFDFLMPGFLGDSRAFGQRYRMPIERGGDTARRDRLAQRVAPFLLRRTKQEVAADLPPKSDILQTIDLGDGQRAIYEGIRLSMHARVKAAIAERGLARSGIIILDALLKLRQACCDPRLLKLKAAKSAKAGSAKLDRLLEMLPEMIDEGRRVLLFSQFTSMLALIEDELRSAKIPYVLLTGDTTDRATPIGRFQGGHVPLFLISLKAGGVGLNLTAADTVIHYDPWWNPAVENQATDRAHRIGQDKPVFVHRLITAGTIEEKMEVLKARKQALVDGILGATGQTGLALTEGDLENLFAPTGH
jgi:superfamily II DNA or RNA helicase